jgi:hypothetical protein
LAVSATAFTAESTFTAAESTMLFALSAVAETAESVLGAVSPLPLQDVKAAAITITVRSFFIEIILVGRKGNPYWLNIQAKSDIFDH